MADRYWVGGTGNWSDEGHWSDTSGGAGGFSIPDFNTDVHFDANSFTAPGQVVTLDEDAELASPFFYIASQSVDFTGITNNPTLAGSADIGFLTNWIGASGLIVTHTGTIVSENNNAHFYGAGLTWNDLRLSATGYFLHESATFRNIFFGSGGSGSESASTTSLTVDAGETITLTGHIFPWRSMYQTRAGFPANTFTIQSSSAGSPFTLSKASGIVALYKTRLKDCTGTGGATFVAVGNSTDVSGNTGWTFSSSVDRYWVGDGGQWSSSSIDSALGTFSQLVDREWTDDRLHWALTSGGDPAPALEPWTTENAIFDANSFSTSGQYVNLGRASSATAGFVACKNFQWTGVANSPTLRRNPDTAYLSSGYNTQQSVALAGVYITGSMTLDAGMSITAGNWQMATSVSTFSYGLPLWDGLLFWFNSTSTNTITTAGVEIGNPFRFMVDTTSSSGNGRWDLQDDLLLDSRSEPLADMIFYRGRFESGNHDITARLVYFGYKRSTSLVVNLGTSTLHLASFNVQDPTTLTLSSATFLLEKKLNGGYDFFNGGRSLFYANQSHYCPSFSCGKTSVTFGTVHATRGLNISLATGDVVTDLTVDNSDDPRVDTLFVIGGSDLTVTNLVIAGDSAVNRILVSGGGSYNPTAGEPTFRLSTSISTFVTTITATSATLSNADFIQIATAGTASPFTGTSLGDAGENSDITFTSPVTRYWVGGTGSFSDSAHWSTSSGGSGGASVPICHDDVVFDANSFSSTSQIVTFDMPRVTDITASAVTNNPTFTIPASTYLAGNLLGLGVFGSITLSSDLTIGSGVGDITILNRGSISLDTGGRTFGGSVIIVQSGAADITLTSDLLMDGRLYIFDDGSSTFDANDFNVTASSGLLYADTIDMGTGTWVFTGNDFDEVLDDDRDPIFDIGASTLTYGVGCQVIFSNDNNAHKPIYAYVGYDMPEFRIAGTNHYIDCGFDPGFKFEKITVPSQTRALFFLFDEIPAGSWEIGEDGVRFEGYEGLDVGDNTEPPWDEFLDFDDFQYYLLSDGDVTAHNLFVKDSNVTEDGNVWTDVNGIDGGNNTGWVFTEDQSLFGGVHTLNTGDEDPKYGVHRTAPVKPVGGSRGTRPGVSTSGSVKPGAKIR